MDKTTQASAGIQEQTCREMGADAFDAAVKALRANVAPKKVHKSKALCTPSEWAAYLEYQRPKSKAWGKANPDKRRAKCNAWQKNNPEKTRKNYRKWRTDNKDKVRARNNAWQKANRDKMRRASKTRYNSRPLYRMRACLRARMRQFFRGKTRTLSAVRDMGCTQEFFKKHIASQLRAGMTLANYGSVWHLDHIYPLAKADIVNDPAHFLAAANWRNIQPMMGPENNAKSDKVTPAAQALFDSLVAEFSAGVHSAA